MKYLKSIWKDLGSKATSLLKGAVIAGGIALVSYISANVSDAADPSTAAVVGALAGVALNYLNGARGQLPPTPPTE